MSMSSLVWLDTLRIRIRNRELLVDAFNVDPIYLKHQNQGRVPDYRHVSLAEELEALLGPNKLTEMLHDDIMAHGLIYIIPAYARAKGNDIYFLRVAMVSEDLTSEDINMTFSAITESADRVLKQMASANEKNGFNYKPMINTDACPAVYRSDDRVNGNK
nr:hypothetical protein BaRGS_022058 [Batillaria attramentaria]